MPRRRRPPPILLNAATVTSMVLCVVAAVLRVRSSTCSELIGRHHIGPVQGGRALVRWFGIYSGEGGFAIGSSETSWRPENYVKAKGVPPTPADEWGRFDNVRAFGDEDGLGFGMVHKVDESPPPAQAFRAAWPRLPAFTYEGSQSYVAVPYWLVIVVAVAWLLWRAYRWADQYGRQKQHDLLGLCPSCGYDLRATPARCPECGAVPPPPPPPAA